jgi:hypothetical protein
MLAASAAGCRSWANARSVDVAGAAGHCIDRVTGVSYPDG